MYHKTQTQCSYMLVVMTAPILSLFYQVAPDADLVSVPSPWLFRHVQATAVPCEATVGPVGVVKAERASVLRITRVLDGDGARHHGDNTVAAGIPLSLNVGRRKMGSERRIQGSP